MPHFADMVYEFGGSPVGARFPLGAGQKHVFVDIAANGGSDGNDGLTPDAAVLSIYMALAKCTSGNRDVIRVMHYASSNEVAWPISMNKSGVTLYAEPGGGGVPRYTNGTVIQSQESDTACIHMDANHIRVEGFDFRAGAGHGGIEFDTAGVSRHGIFNCSFTSGLYGVWATVNQAPSVGLHVKGCYFLESITSHGINYDSDGPFARFEDNVFLSVGGNGIDVYGGDVATAKAGAILNNFFGLDSDTKGNAITIDGQNVGRWIIGGNLAGYLKDADAASTNPFLDTSSTGNNWLWNCKGVTPTEPDTS